MTNFWNIFWAGILGGFAAVGWFMFWLESKAHQANLEFWGRSFEQEVGEKTDPVAYQQGLADSEARTAPIIADLRSRIHDLERMAGAK